MDLLQSVVKDTGRTLTSEDLKHLTRTLSQELDACQQRYEALRLENKANLKQYKAKTGEVARQWLAARHDITSLLDECSFVNSLGAAPGTDLQLDTFAEHRKRQLYLTAGECALSDDLDGARFEHEGGAYLVRQTAVSLITRLKETPSEVASRLYARLYARQHADRLAVLPQAAVLFLSECHLLHLIDDHCEDLKQFGGHFLQQHIDVLLGEIRELADNGGAVCLDADNIEHILKRPYKQLLLQLNRFQSVLAECMTTGWLRDVHERTMILLTRALCDALWTNILDATGGIAKDSHPVLRDIIQSVIEFGSQHGQPDYTVLLKLGSLLALSEQPLLAWMGAFRKKTVHPALTAADYFLLVRSFFSDSSLRTSCLDEIEAEVEDEGEEEGGEDVDEEGEVE